MRKQTAIFRIAIGLLPGKTKPFEFSPTKITLSIQPINQN